SRLRYISLFNHGKSLIYRPATPATHPGTAVSLASVQSPPLEQSGQVASTDCGATSAPDVAGLLPLPRVLKKLFNRSGSLAPPQDSLRPNIVECSPDGTPTGRSNQDGIEELNADGSAATAIPTTDKGARRTVTAITWAAVKDTLRIVVRVSDVFPPLKSATAGVLAVIERVEVVDDNQKEFTELNMKLNLLVQLLESSKDDITPSLHDWINGLARSFEEKSKIIENKKNDHYMKKLLDSTFDTSFIKEELQSLTFAIDIILVQTNLKTNITVTKMAHNAILDRLGHVSGSEFHREDREGCLEGTRVMLLADILVWATDFSSPHIFWLNGMAGTGKTTVTETFCSIIHRKEILGASFFCSRHKGRVDTYQIFPSLARVLAQKHPSFEKALTKILEQDIDPVGMNLQEQYQTLIFQPAQVAFKGSSESIILSVDALDECENAEKATEKFLKAIMDNIPSVPLKFFLAGRPEMALRNTITSASGSQVLRLHDIADHIVEADIGLYLNKRLHYIKELRETYTPWPPSELTAIVKKAGKLFIYASTAYKYISNEKGDPCCRLEELASSTQSLAVKGVDDLYTIILNHTFEDLNGKEQQQIQSCLSAIICAQTPMTAAVCSKLLNITSGGVRRALISLHAVLQVPENDNETERITLYHASFFDFVTSKEKSGAKPWFIDTTGGHCLLAEKCLSIMNKELYFNIAGATTSYKSNDEQHLKIPTHLDYVCTTWGDHLLLSADGNRPLSKSLIQVTEDFLEQKFLYWLEVLSVNKMVRYGSSILYRLSKTLLVSSKIRDIANQFSQFVHAFSAQIEDSTPHIYLSALPFSMQNSMIRMLFSKEFPSIVHVEGLNIQNALWQCELDSAVSSVIFSPDGKYIVCGSDDQTVRVWNVETAVGNPIQGHTDGVTSASFSPDGKYIVSGSGDQTVHLWNMETGQAVRNHTNAHTDWTSCTSTFKEDGNNHSIHLQPNFFHHQSHSSYTITDSGKVIDPSGHFYFWIPQHLLGRVCQPGNPFIFGVNCIKLDLSKFVHGEDWVTCKQVL
ncbi:hypothetical protein BDQ12DRAFT_760176, partial [Crucibulum laeve]